MLSKDEIQNSLKEKFSINKNISASLSKEECERIFELLKYETIVAKLIESYVDKNSKLAGNNSAYGRSVSKAKSQLEYLEKEYDSLKNYIESIEEAKITLEEKKKLLEAEKNNLEGEVKFLTSNNEALTFNVKTLTEQNHELTGANERLKKDNKDLKNLVDQIKLRLARDTKELLKYENSELKKAVIRLFAWTLG